jgi:hypothetical protein
MGRAEQIQQAGGEIEADRRLTNAEICLARRIGPKQAADLMLDISKASALTALEALIRQTPAPRQETNHDK